MQVAAHKAAIQKLLGSDSGTMLTCDEDGNLRLCSEAELGCHHEDLLLWRLSDEEDEDGGLPDLRRLIQVHYCCAMRWVMTSMF